MKTVTINGHDVPIPEEQAGNQEIPAEQKQDEYYHVRYLNVAHLKHYVKERAGKRVSVDYLEALDRRVQLLIDQSLRGFNAYTKRKTLRSGDLQK